MGANQVKKAGLFTLLLCAVIIAPFRATDSFAQPEPLKARITLARGLVGVLPAGEALWRPGAVDMYLGGGDSIRVGRASAAELMLPDSSLIRIAQNTLFKVDRLELEEATRARNSIFSLAAGHIRAVIAEAVVTLIKARQSEFAVHTPTAVASARGTDMVVEHKIWAGTSTDFMLRGSGALQERTTGGTVILVANQYARALPGLVPAPPAILPPEAQGFLVAVITPVETPPPPGVKITEPAVPPPATAPDILVIPPEEDAAAAITVGADPETEVAAAIKAGADPKAVVGAATKAGAEPEKVVGAAINAGANPADVVEAATKAGADPTKVANAAINAGASADQVREGLGAAGSPIAATYTPPTPPPTAAPPPPTRQDVAGAEVGKETEKVREEVETGRIPVASPSVP